MDIQTMKKDIVEIITTFDNYLDSMYDRGQFDPTTEQDKKIDEFMSRMKKRYLKNTNPEVKEKQYIIICLSATEEYGPDNFFQGVYKTKEAAEISLKNDMKNYLLSETEAGRRAKIEGNKIVWENDDSRFAKWFIYEV